MVKKNTIIGMLMMVVAISLSACGEEQDIQSAIETNAAKEELQTGSVKENVADENIAEPDAEPEQKFIPSKEEVLAMRARVLEGMSEAEIERLTENIKIANLQMESGYLNDNLFEKLSDKDSPYWLYFDQKGEFQIGWWYQGTICSKDFIMWAENLSEEEFSEKYNDRGMVYNRFDADNFIDLIAEMQLTVHNEQLSADLQKLIDLTRLAQETHEMEYANEIYKILHDMDYFLLRYGIEDVGKYVKDDGMVSTYYGVLDVYDPN